MTTIDENLIDLIVQEVLRKLCSPLRPRILVLICGGTTGAEQALSQLENLITAGYELSVVFTTAAVRILGTSWLGELRSSVTCIDENQAVNPAELLQTVDLVLIPVLTANSAAKIAHGIADNLVTNLVRHSLLIGKPVIAARDACDLNSPQWRASLPAVNAYYRQLNAQNLTILNRMGLELTAVEQLGTKVAALSSPVSSRQPVAAVLRPGLPSVFSQRVLSASDILASPGSILHISKNTIVTPAAYDLARERAISIVVE